MASPDLPLVSEEAAKKIKDAIEAAKNNGPFPDTNPVTKPAHYTSFLVREPGEVIDVIEAWGLPYHLGNVVKYIARANLKGKYIEDLKKARWYLDRYIAKLEGKNVVP